METLMRQTRLQAARRLVQALETGDTLQERAASDAWAQLHKHAPADLELARITRELREALSSLPISEMVSRLLRSMLDVQVQLNQALEISERAAHQTLAAVEASLRLVQSITDAANAFRMEGADALVRDELLLSLLACIDAEAAQLKSHLSEVLIAQGFQDITGQITQRIAKLVGELETHVRDGGVPASDMRQIRRACEGAAHGQVPARPDGYAAHVVSGQQEVDDLLSGLGF
jgi:chemotaxis protein CheZ